MPARSHRSDYVILAALGLATVGIVLALAASGWISRRDEARRPPAPTTHSTDTHGAMAYYMLLERLNVPVRRWEQPMLKAQLAGLDAVFCLDPIVDLEGDEGPALRQWVSDGGVLICTRYPASLLEEDSRERPEAGGRYTVAYAENGPGGEGVTQVPTKARADILARDVAAVHFLSSKTLDGDLLGQAALAPWFADARGVRIAARSLGKGTIVVVADCSFLTNGLLGQEDNAVLAANLAWAAMRQGRPTRVAFDEYHQGFGRRESSWSVLWAVLVETPPGWAILCATAAMLCYLAYKARRFGIRRAPAGGLRRRSKLEFVRSVGATYRAAGANRLTLRILFSHLRSRCARAAGLNEPAGAAQIADRLARRTGGQAERYQGVLKRCEAAVRRPRLSRRRLKALLAELADIESEIRDGR